ncbi:MAG: 50S ribosomal protein L11 methyltransferase [Pseudomonadota bacterium]
MSPADRVDVPASLWPSEYTALLLQTLRQHVDWVRGARVLEIGSGSGVLLAASGTLGAAALCGVDIAAEAVAATLDLLRRAAFDAEIEVLQGNLFAPVVGRRFDLITANLPHFPMRPEGVSGRLPSWSSGGLDGRCILDPFLAGLGQHLTPEGRAVIVHNAFDDLDATRAVAGHQGLGVRVLATILVHLAPPKLAVMTPAVLERETGRTIHRYGAHTFGEVHAIAIGRSSVTEMTR